jgi:hypothetical protein
MVLILVVMFNGVEKFDGEYGPFKAAKPVEIFRINDLMGLTIDTRQPGLMEQRYSYDDDKLCCVPPVIPDVARLRELPLQLRNWYSAIVPYEMTLLDSYYQPSRIVGNKYKGECKLSSFQYDSKRPVYPYRISPYDPNIFLPAEQADRSKISIDKYMAAGFQKMK